MVVAYGAFAAFVRLSALWSDDASLAVLETERALVYVAGALAAVTVVTRRSAPHLLAGVVGAATALCAYSIVAGARPAESLEGPIGYANALGIVAAIGILAAAGIARASPRSSVRAACALALVPLTWALVLSGSRGSAVALAIGVGVALALASRVRLVFAATVACALGVAALALAGVDVARLVEGDRWAYWRVAWMQFEERPLVGSGAGSFHAYWREHRPDPATLDTPDVLDAHSLYFETLAELGLAGLALVLVAIFIPIAVAIGRRADTGVAAGLPAYAAFAVHAGLDWDWEMPAVTLLGIFCGVAVVAAARGDDGWTLRPLARLAGLVIALALLASGLVRLI
jgi:hypothetical protein